MIDVSDKCDSEIELIIEKLKAELEERKKHRSGRPKEAIQYALKAQRSRNKLIRSLGRYVLRQTDIETLAYFWLRNYSNKKLTPAQQTLVGNLCNASGVNIIFSETPNPQMIRGNLSFPKRDISIEVQDTQLGVSFEAH